MLEKLFHVRASGSSIRTEILAGITTFMTMAYIIFVNPAILSDEFGAGMDFESVAIATCLASAFATLVMAFVAKYPIALAPGMGLNAFFSYEVCGALGLDWKIALAMVFVSGCLFTILTFVRARELIVKAIPKNLKFATAVGIGVFIAYIGLMKAGIVSFTGTPIFVDGKPVGLSTSREIIPELGNFHLTPFLLAVFGLIVTTALMARRIRGAVLIGIIVTGIAAIIFREVTPEKAQLKSWIPVAMPKWPESAFALDFKGLWTTAVIGPIIILLFFDMLDTIGTLIGVGGRAGMLDKDGNLPRVNRALLADSTGTIFGSLIGTSTTTSYIESAAGIADGGRTGLTAVVVAACFLVSIFFIPLAKLFGTSPCVTAPALIAVGAMMMTVIKEIQWDDWSESIPAFLTIIIMPLTYSIAHGLAVGFIFYAVLKLLSGKGRDVHWLAYLLAAIFLCRYIFLPWKFTAG
ncbi:MAG: NCS2 family permease [Planctomycetota bacterium]|nr:MAG: NCS2 family permease [Planctomycetota bacterium]